MEALVQTTAVPPGDWVIVLPLVLALLSAALVLMLRKARGLSFLLTLLTIAAIIACEAALLSRIVATGPVSMTMGNWLPPFGISFTADLVGAGFALAAAVVTLIVLIYAEAERSGRDGRDGFHALLMLLLAGVTGSFLTGDMFNLYVWFEVMLIASFGLMVMGGGAERLDGAVKYGFLNFLSASLFLLALGLLYGLLGTLNMADIMRVAPSANPAAMTAISAILLLAFCMKAAAFPVNAWLPASYHTPPVAISALLAGLLTKVGVYALLRALVAVLPGSREVLEPVLATIAIATLVVAPLGAIAETNLRRAIGFMVIGGIGSVVAGVALASSSGVAGAAAYIFHAMLTMTGLYLAAGLVERQAGQRDWRNMGALYAASAPLSIMFLILVLAAAGVPPFLGFWPKLLLLEAALGVGGWSGGLLAGALVVNAVLTLIAGSRLWTHIFWRAAAADAPRLIVSRGEGWARYGAAGLLVAMIVAAGLWPTFIFEIAIGGAGDMLDPARYVAATGLAEGTP